MNCLVLGGTGAMGAHLVKLFSEQGFNTVVTTRASKKSYGNVEYRKGNAKNMPFLEELLSEKWDVIVDFMVYNTSSFKNRVELLLGSTKHYIFLSSARVYSNSEHPIKEESGRLLDVSKDDEFLKTDEYALSKARQENILLNSEKKNWTIVRPYITFSETRLQLGVFEKEEWLYRALRGRKIVFSIDILSKLTTMTYGLDVSKCIFALINCKNTLGEVYHICSDEVLKWQEVLDIYLEVLEEKLGNRPAVLLEGIENFKDLKVPILKYQILYDRLYDRKFDTSKLTKVDQNVNFDSPRTLLRKCLIEFLKNPIFNQINWQFEAIKDKYTGERTSLTEISGIKQKLKYLYYRYL